MIWAILISFFVFLQISSADVKVSEADIDSKERFLDDLQSEIEQKCEIGIDANQDELDQYIENIASAKNALKSIETEQKKGKNRDKKLLQDLVDDFNKKMKILEKSRNSIRKREKNDLDDANFSNRGNFDSIDSLNWNKKKKQINNDSEFNHIELVEIPECDSIPNGTKTNRNDGFIHEENQ